MAVDVGAGIAGEGPITSGTLHVPEFRFTGVGAYRVTVATGCGLESPSDLEESGRGIPVLSAGEFCSGITEIPITGMARNPIAITRDRQV
ncbi:hypothetical protein ACFRNJ_12265 [Streptomyces sp. NPDC056721]|uniref:hypothetical protein n=1 Tax=Streptomyces sp. NPDC056721 TaxID=3345923 RepID=UPI0036AB33B3